MNHLAIPMYLNAVSTVVTRRTLCTSTVLFNVSVQMQKMLIFKFKSLISLTGYQGIHLSSALKWNAKWSANGALHLICESLWLKVCAKWINANVKLLSPDVIVCGWSEVIEGVLELLTTETETDWEWKSVCGSRWVKHSLKPPSVFQSIHNSLYALLQGPKKINKAKLQTYMRIFS